MSDDVDTIPERMTAGRMLREARQAHGLHIAALASAIKVAPRKLELLESDRFDELPDATFTRALAQTVCRSLKIDAAPVLALLPLRGSSRLDQVNEGLNAPFHGRPGRPEPNDLSGLARPAIWGPVLVLAVAAVVYFLPLRWLEEGPGPTAQAPARPASAPPLAMAPIASAPAEAGPTVAAADGALAAPTAGVASMPATDAASAAPSASASAPGALVSTPASSATSALTTSAASMPSLAASQVERSALATPGTARPVEPASGSKASIGSASGILRLHVSSKTWVEVLDARGQSLLSRLVEPGEALGFDGDLPMQLKIGNAAAAEVSFRGEALHLAPFTRGNVARVELK